MTGMTANLFFTEIKLLNDRPQNCYFGHSPSVPSCLISTNECHSEYNVANNSFPRLPYPNHQELYSQRAMSTNGKQLPKSTSPWTTRKTMYLNPCFKGKCSKSYYFWTRHNHQSVFILVLMEDTLGIMNIFPSLRQYVGVLIHVLIEEALGVPNWVLINLIYSGILIFTIYMIIYHNIKYSNTNIHLK